MTARPILIDSEGGPRLRIVGDSVRVLATGSDTGAYEVFETTGPRESGPPPHAHPWSESYFVVDGELDVMIDGNVTRVVRGGFVNIPAGTIHAYRIASEQAKFVVITSPRGASDFFHEMDSVAGGSMDVEKIIGVALRHGLTVPPPPA
jgi:quercetin dioxygenase-like cupin family protein